MKAISIWLLALVATSTIAADIRVVGNAKVDLQPIHDWEQKHEGERPLKHWKKIHIVASFGNMGAYTKCEVRVEGGQATTNLIANVPATLLAKLAQEASLRARLAQWANADKAEKRRILEADAKTPTGAYGTPEYVNGVMARREQVNTDAEKLRQSREDWKEANEKHTALVRELAAESDYAMFTGGSYAGMPIMEIGKKK